MALGWKILIGVITFVVTPFATTGVLRVMPSGWPLSLPFILFGCVGLALLFTASTRSVGVGMLAAVGCHGIAILWLLSVFGGGPP